MFGFKKILKVAAMAVPLAFGSVATNADTVQTDGTPFAFSWSFLASNGVDTQLITGDGTISATIVGGNLVLAVTLNNTTVVPSGNNMSLMSFGFGIDPNAASVSISGGTIMLDASLDSIPSLATIEVCAWGGNSCNGGSVNDGIAAGGSDSFSLTLAAVSGSSWGSTVDIAPIGFKFQGTIGSFEFYSSSSSSSSSSGSGSGETSSSSSGAVPEPASSTLVGLGLGLLGFGFMRRRKNAA